MKKFFLSLLMSTMIINAIGCGAEKTIDTEIDVETENRYLPNDVSPISLLGDIVNYAVEALSVPHENIEYGIMCETVYQNTLYYLCYEEDKTLLCQLDLGDSGRLKTIPIDIPPNPYEYGLQQMAVSVNGLRF